MVNNKRPHHMGPCELLWKHWFWFRVRWDSTEDLSRMKASDLKQQNLTWAPTLRLDEEVDARLAIGRPLNQTRVALTGLIALEMVRRIRILLSCNILYTHMLIHSYSIPFYGFLNQLLVVFFFILYFV